MKKSPEELRSALVWRRDLRSFGHRSRAKQMGYAAGFCWQTGSRHHQYLDDLTTCHSHFRTRPMKLSAVSGGLAVSGRTARDAGQ